VTYGTTNQTLFEEKRFNASKNPLGQNKSDRSGIQSSKTIGEKKINAYGTEEILN